jgi:hypothetical protein
MPNNEPNQKPITPAIREALELCNSVLPLPSNWQTLGNLDSQDTAVMEFIAMSYAVFVLPGLIEAAKADRRLAQDEFFQDLTQLFNLVEKCRSKSSNAASRRTFGQTQLVLFQEIVSRVQQVLGLT